MGLAEMILGMQGGGGYAPQSAAAPPARSRLEELLTQLGALDDQPPPSRFGDLPPDARQQARGQGLMALAQAIGGTDEGHLGYGLARGVGAAGQIQDEAVQRAALEARQRQQDARANIGRQIEVERALRDERRLSDQEQAQQGMRGQLGSLATALKQHLDPNDPRGIEADALAASGDHAGLAKLAGDVHSDMQKRELAKRYGIDPGDPQALARAEEIAKQEDLKARGLGPYYQKPPDGHLVQDQNGRYVLVDPRSGRSTPTPVLGPLHDGSQTREDKENDADLRQATTIANQQRNLAETKFQKDTAAWAKAGGIGPDGRPMPQPQPPQVDFEQAVQQQFEMLRRTRAAAKVPKPLNPIEGDAAHAPVSSTGAQGKTQPQTGADDVMKLLPKGVLLKPEARAVIEQKLRGGATARQVAAQILAELGG